MLSALQWLKCCHPERLTGALLRQPAEVAGLFLQAAGRCFLLRAGVILLQPLQFAPLILVVQSLRPRVLPEGRPEHGASDAQPVVLVAVTAPSAFRAVRQAHCQLGVEHPAGRSHTGFSAYQVRVQIGRQDLLRPLGYHHHHPVAAAVG